VAVDVAVVGRELCGLVAGALCAQAGRRVMVVDDGDAGARVLGDRLVPLAASLWRLPAGGPVTALLDDLGHKADARRVLGDPIGIGVVDDPDLRCTFPIGDDARTRELARVFGERGRGLAATLQAFDPSRRHAPLQELRALHEDGWFFEARRAKKRVLALGSAADADVDDVDTAPFFGDSDGVAPVLAQLGPFVQWRSGAPTKGLMSSWAAQTLQGGTTLGTAGLGPRAALADLLLSFITHRGGELVRDRVTAVDASGRTVTALRLEQRRDEVVPTAVIDATWSRDLVDRLPSGRAREKLLTQQGRVVAAGGTTSARWLLPARVLPRGMPPVLLVLDGEGTTPVLVMIGQGAPVAETGKGSHIDEQLVYVVATAPTKDGSVIEAVLERLLPFARSAARATDIVDVSALCAHYELKDSEHSLGGRRPRTPWKNLVRAGRDLAPAWGTDGEIVAARSVFALVDRVFPKPPKA
jgi:hypothetical protein